MNPFLPSEKRNPPFARSTRILRQSSRGDFIFLRSLSWMTSLSAIVVLCSFLFLATQFQVSYFTEHFFFYLKTSVLTLLTASVGVLLGLPFAVKSASWMSERQSVQTHLWFARALTFYDSVPSILWGVWGASFAASLLHTYEVLSLRLTGGDGGTSFFKTQLMVVFIACVMGMPTIANIARRVFARIPEEECEAAFGLGLSAKEVFRRVIWPQAKHGVIGAYFIACARVIGEGIAMALILPYALRENLLSSHLLTVMMAEGSGHAFRLEGMASAACLLLLFTVFLQSLGRYFLHASTRFSGTSFFHFFRRRRS